MDEGCVARAGDAEEYSGGTQIEGNKAAAEGAAGQDDRREATLQVEGTAETAFTGICLVGDKEISIGREASQSFTYILDGRKLDCEIQKEEANTAALEVVLRGNIARIQEEVIVL